MEWQKVSNHHIGIACVSFYILHLRLMESWNGIKLLRMNVCTICNLFFMLLSTMEWHHYIRMIWNGGREGYAILIEKEEKMPVQRWCITESGCFPYFSFYIRRHHQRTTRAIGMNHVFMFAANWWHIWCFKQIEHFVVGST